MIANIFEILHREFIYVWYYFEVQLRQILPYFLMGIVIGSIKHLPFFDILGLNTFIISLLIDAFSLKL